MRSETGEILSNPIRGRPVERDQRQPEGYNADVDLEEFCNLYLVHRSVNSSRTTVSANSDCTYARRLNGKNDR